MRNGRYDGKQMSKIMRAIIVDADEIYRDFNGEEFYKISVLLMRDIDKVFNHQKVQRDKYYHCDTKYVRGHDGRFHVINTETGKVITKPVSRKLIVTKPTIRYMDIEECISFKGDLN